MPYIKQEKRLILENYLEEIAPSLEAKGELTYCIYKLGIEYLKHHDINYQNISDCISAMNDAAAEFRRRILNDYEDEKIRENGDII